MQLPEKFLERTEKIIGNSFEDFVNSFSTAPPVSVQVNTKLHHIPSDKKVSWCGSGYYLPQRPNFTADPFLHAGIYYVQEASSMFIAEVLQQLVRADSVALDLCAAPGGKSILLSRHVNEKGLLVSNEIIHSRANILTENLIKWGNEAVVVSNNAPKDFKKLNSFFDVILGDAPCSGEGMFRKDKGAIEEWSLQNVKMCAARQKDILSAVWGSLKKDGILIYSTCTFNEEENEQNVEWMEENLGAEFIPIDIQRFPEITFSCKGYRFYPHKTKGEGLFIAALRKTENRTQIAEYKQQTADIGHQKSGNRGKNNFPKLTKEAENLRNYLKNTFEWKIFQRNNNLISAFPTEKYELLEILEKNLKIMHSGITLAEQKGKDFIPDISLALSKSLDKEKVKVFDVDYNTAIQYLRRENIAIDAKETGYILITHKDIPLGWIKNLGNRCNNLYPKEWRIRTAVSCEK